ncbi:MAG TPA: phospholipase D-like domain-containing protein [Solirubrobacteraceae bacterium]|nr:phospholipase D-like domain-containing protein [Solirubrobacteraceae bacterium]
MSRGWGHRTRSRRRVLVALSVAVLATAAVVAGVADIAASVASVASAGDYQLVQYPNAGFGGLRAQIARAHHSIDMEMYELADPATERALVTAAARGVRVRVLLDQAFSGAEVNQPAVAYLRGHGVQVKWGPRGYIFHIKATSFDGAVSDISTANLVAKYYRTTRDAEIIDADPAQVRAIEATFAHDFNAGPSGVPREQTVQAPGLVWSPNTGSGTAETALVSQISAARHAVDFTSEELADPAIYQALARDARRGVTCRVVMTRSSDWDTAFQTLTRAGCRVHVFPDSATALYIHEKLILDDPGRAGESMLLGSQNASVTSLTRNRELGIVLNDHDGGAHAIAAASATFSGDFAHAAAW